MDGPSSDFYSYDTETQSVSRLTDGPQQIWSIDWPPNGEWIRHTATNRLGAGMALDYYAVKPDNATVKALPYGGLTPTFHEWISPASYLAWDRVGRNPLMECW